MKRSNLRKSSEKPKVKLSDSKRTQNTLAEAFKKESKGLKDAINKLRKLSRKADIMESELEAIDEAMQHIQKRYMLVINMQKLLEFSEDSYQSNVGIANHNKDISYKKVTCS